MEQQDIRWLQRFSNFKKALAQLSRFVAKGASLNELEQIGLVKAFEFTWELAWNTLKDYYEYQGATGLQGSRDVIQLAFKRGLITNGDCWMHMLKDRNRAAHTYNEETAFAIGHAIINSYFHEFSDLQLALEQSGNSSSTPIQTQ